MNLRQIIDLLAYRPSKRYYWLLASTMSMTALAPLAEHQVVGRFLLGALAVLALVTASLASNTSRKLNRVALFLAGLNVLVWTPVLFASNVPVGPHIQNIAFALCLLFVVTLGLIMMQDIFTNEVNGNRVAGAICVYMLIGFSFAVVHMMILNNDMSSYRDSSDDYLLKNKDVSKIAGQKIYPLFVYYSFCTISTVGYGDIVPVSRVARTMSWLEAVTGQIYLTVLVARLVGLHIASAASASSNLSARGSGSDGMTVSVGLTNVDQSDEPVAADTASRDGSEAAGAIRAQSPPQF